MLGFHAVSEAPLSHAAVAVAAAVSYVDGAVEFGREPVVIPRGGLSRNRKPELPILNLAHPMSDGLVSALAFYEGAGNTAYDLSSYGNNAYISHWDYFGGPMEVGEAVWEVDGERSLKLNSTDLSGSRVPSDIDVVEQTGGKVVDALSGSNSWSMVWWQKINSSENGSGRQGCIFHNGAAAYLGTGRSLLITVNGGKLEVDHTGVGSVYSDASLTFDEWQQIAVTYDGSTERVYINGVEKASSSVVLDLSSSTLRWGNNSGGTSTTDMKLQSTLIYERSLSANDVKELYINPYGIYGSSPPLIPALSTVAVAEMSADATEILAGVLSVSSTGSLSPDANLKLAGEVSLSSSATLTTGSPVALSGTIIATGPSTVTFNGSVSVAGAASVSGSASLSTEGRLKLSGELSLSTTAEILDPSAFGNLIVAGFLSLSGSSSVTADGKLSLSAAQVISGQATLTSDGSSTVKAAASLSSTSTLTTGAASMPTGIGILTGPSVVGVVGSVKISGKLSASSSATLSSIGNSSVQAATSISGQGTLSAGAQLSLAGGVSVSGAASATTVGKMSLSGKFTISQFGSFDHKEFDNSFQSASRLDARATQTQIHSATLSSSATMTVEEGVSLKAVIILTGPSSLSVSGEVMRLGAIAVSSTGSLSTSGAVARTGIIALSNQGSVSINGVLTNRGIVGITSSAELIGVGKGTLAGSISIIGSSTVEFLPVTLLPDNILVTLYIDKINSLSASINQNKTLNGSIFQQMNTNLNLDLQSSTSGYIDQELSVGLER